jgi:hypothetical protein
LGGTGGRDSYLNLACGCVLHLDDHRDGGEAGWR